MNRADIYALTRDGARRRRYHRNSLGEFTSYRRRDRAYDDDEMDERSSSRSGRSNYDRNYDRSYDRRYDDYDHHSEMEYNKEDDRLSHKEIKRWAAELENPNGMRGAKFPKEMVEEVAEKMNVRYRDFNPDELWMTVNMLYSDYSEAIPNVDLATYVKLAKAFLEDDDASVKGGEKLATYYCAIVED